MLSCYWISTYFWVNVITNFVGTYLYDELIQFYDDNIYMIFR